MGRKKNGNGILSVEEIVEKLKKLGENESITMKATRELEEPYVAEMGFFAKGGRGTYQIRLRYGITNLLKIRSRDDFEQIKRLVKFLEDNQQYVEAIEHLNPKRRARSIIEDTIWY